MERKFFIAKSMIKDNSRDVLYHLLEETDKGLEEIFSELNGGEKKIEVICKKLVQMMKERVKLSKSSLEPLGGFTLTSIERNTIKVELDSRLTLFHPLRNEEMTDFYHCYFKVGKYL